MKTKLVLTISYDYEMNLKYKARLVGCGYSQIKFRDYDETYALTIATMIILVVMHFASSQKLNMGTFDVSGAFLRLIMTIQTMLGCLLYSSVKELEYC